MFKLTKISKISKGGETMKTLVLMLALMLVIGGGVLAETATIDVYTGFNLVAAPLVPINPDPLSVFAGAADGIDGVLSRYEPTGGIVGYDSLDPSLFGNVLLGDGFWLNVYSGAQTLSYEGVPDGVPDGAGVKTDMWISLPGNSDAADAGGIHLIGQPFAHNTLVDPTGAGTGSGIFFTDGTSLKNWSEAVAATWVSDTIAGYNAVGGIFDVKYDGLGYTDTLEAGRGYWVTTYKDNIAMIIPAN